MFDYNSIDEYQLEITSYCNAACPQCPRNNNGEGVNPRMPLCHLSRDVIDRAFPVDVCARLRQIFFCGSYGDPIMHPDFLDILRDFRKKIPPCGCIFIPMAVRTMRSIGQRSPGSWQDMVKLTLA